MSDELKSNATEPMAEAAPAEAALPTPADNDSLANVRMIAVFACRSPSPDSRAAASHSKSVAAYAARTSITRRAAPR